MLTYDKPFAPPVQLRIAGWILLASFLTAIALAITMEQTGLSIPLVQVGMAVANAVACIYLGIAANRLGKSWLLYGLLPAASTILLFSFYSYLKLRSDARFKWLDRHATYVPDRSA